VSGWGLEQQGNAVACLEITGSASPSVTKVTFVDAPRARWPALVRDLIDHPSYEEQVRVKEGRGHRGNPMLDGDDEEKGFRSIRRNLGERHPYYALALAGWGMQYHWAGQDAVAEGLLKQAMAVSEGSLGPLHPDHALIASSLGRVYRDLGKPELAGPLQSQASRIAEVVFGRRGDRSDTILQEQAALEEGLGRFAQAETLLRQRVDENADAPPRARAEALSALGAIEARMGEREKAAALLGQAQGILEAEIQRIWKELGSMGPATPLAVGLAGIQVQRGWLALQGGKPGAARELARAAFLGMCQFHSGIDRSRSGRLMGWDQPITNVTPNWLLTDQPGFSRVMIHLAELFLALGDLHPACGCIQVLDLALGQTQRDLAAVYRLMSKVREASPRGSVTSYLDPARVPERYKRETEYEFRMRTPRPGDPVIAPDEYWLGLAVREYEQSVGREHPETLDALKDQARKQWRSRGPAAAEATLRDAWARSVALVDRVLPGLPEVQAYQFLEVNRPPADLLLSLYRATGGDRACTTYEVLWGSKALATRQLMDRRQLLLAATGAGRPEIARLAEELQATRQELARVTLAAFPEEAAERRRTRLAELSRRKEDLERELARLSEPFRRARQADRTGVAELVRRLPARTVVVDLVERWRWTPPAEASGPWGRRRGYDAFVLRPAGGEPGWSATWLDLGDADSLDTQLDRWIAGIRPGGQVDRPAGQEVRRRLWSPIEGALGDAHTVLVVPDGRLAQVPWNAIPGRRPDSYLIEDYALAQAPYGQFVARLLDDPPPTGDGFLLVGGIDYGPGGKWPYLGGTAVEVEQLAGLRPGPETVRLGGQSATQSQLRALMPGRRFIHLATHGEFLDPGSGRDPGRFEVSDSSSAGARFDVTARNPLVLSKLVLAGANRRVETDAAGVPVGDDGVLTAEEVIGMDLTRTELVVLSACETGAGKVRGGEGVFSLERAFHVAGARAVVASLWAVDDRATQALMARFYRNLWADPKSSPGKLEALREAQLWLLREGAGHLATTRGGLVRPGPVPSKSLPPAYWAAFVLSGDWR
jgi:CHAT domain-containing protein/tetratricopeptide (TPR) repeat protein